MNAPADPIAQSQHPASPTGRRAFSYSPTAEQSTFLHQADYQPRHSTTVPATPRPFRLRD